MSKMREAMRRAERGNGQDPIPKRTSAGRDGAGPIRAAMRTAPPLGYQRLRMWLTNRGARDRRVQTVMVVACRSGTGATTTASLLAATLAEGKQWRVLIIDGNFRTPSLNRVFNVRSKGGVSSVLKLGLAIEAEIQPTNRENLFVMAGGPFGVDSDIFEGKAFDDLLVALKDRFDFIVFDGAPLLEFPDTYALAPKVDGVILVVEADHTTVEEAQRAKTNLEQAGAPILGVVLNRQKKTIPRALQRLFRSSV